MLWIYAKINGREIGRLGIHNQGEIRKGVYEYKVYKAEECLTDRKIGRLSAHEHILRIHPEKFKVVRHKREDGWEKLTIKALKLFDKKKMNKEKSFPDFSFQESTGDG